MFMFGQILPKISTFATDPDPDHVAKSTPVCKINLPLLLVNHLDLSFLLRFNTNRVREVVMSGESISFIMIVIEVQKCFVFESYYTDITRIVDSYPPVGVDSSHLSVCF